MKKLFMMALLAVCMTAHADDDSNSGLTISKSESIEWDMHLSIGWNAPISAPEGYKFAPFRSWDFNWTIVQFNYNPVGASQTYSVGLGLGWHNYTLKDDKVNNAYPMFVNDNKAVSLGLFPTGAENRASRIHIMSINVPLLFNQRLGNDFSLSVGAQVNFNVYGRLHNEYDLDDDEMYIDTKNFEYRPITIDPMLMLHCGDVGLYCRYSPMSVLKKNYGPDFKNISFGIYF